MILADAHVHLHRSFPPMQFLDAALANFTIAARTLLDGRAFTGILLFAEGRNETGFQTLRDNITPYTPPSHSTWQLKSTKEPFTLVARSSKHPALLLIAGRQLVTAERLEILALATDQKFAEGLPFADTIEVILSANALPVIPWGTGKWWGKRGKFLSAFLHRYKGNNICLGDNGGRPIFWPTPTLFKYALAKQMKILPGSDPLPFSTESSKVGSFGFAASGVIADDYPAESLKKLIADPATSIHPYGQLETPFRFLRHQVAMQFVKRRFQPLRVDK